MKNKIWMKHRNNSEMDFKSFSQDPHVGHFSQTVSYTAHRFFIDKPFESPEEYRDLVQVLLTAQEGELVEIVLSSPGGCIESAMNVISAMKESEAVVRGIVMGSCHSAASLIALSCDELVVFDYCTMLCHSATFRSQGRTTEIVSHVKFLEKYLEKLTQEMYTGFLSPSEIKEMLEGKDFWFDAEEIRERLQLRSELQKKEQHKQMKELKKQQKQETPLAKQTKKL